MTGKARGKEEDLSHAVCIVVNPQLHAVPSKSRNSHASSCAVRETS